MVTHTPSSRIPETDEDHDPRNQPESFRTTKPGGLFTQRPHKDIPICLSIDMRYRRGTQAENRCRIPAITFEWYREMLSGALIDFCMQRGHENGNRHLLRCEEGITVLAVGLEAGCADDAGFCCRHHRQLRNASVLPPDPQDGAWNERRGRRY